MQYRPLGDTGISISAVSFGAGPVAALMTGADEAQQVNTVSAALQAGINWFDTAAGYGRGRSEAGLGAALAALGASRQVHLATKVRLAPTEMDDIAGSVRQSVERSLQRLRVERLTLLQLHNAIAPARGADPDAITPADVLGRGGVLEAFSRLRQEGLIAHTGLTATGRPGALREVIQSGAFQTAQVPYNLVDIAAARAHGPDGSTASPADGSPDLRPQPGSLLAECMAQGMGILAIRVFAGGALAGGPPSAHTQQTKYFPLAMYHRDQRRCERVRRVLEPGADLREIAVRYVLSHPGVASAIIGFGAPEHVSAAAAYQASGPLPPAMLRKLAELWSGQAMEADE